MKSSPLSKDVGKSLFLPRGAAASYVNKTIGTKLLEPMVFVYPCKVRRIFGILLQNLSDCKHSQIYGDMACIRKYFRHLLFNYITANNFYG